jgi:FkbH-like protein
MAVSLDALPVVASRLMDILCALKGKINKCLVLDLDNTLWAGIVGDDGWEHVKPFVDFQKWIKKLKERGIILAVCSKNDEAKAKEPFEKHPEMVLRLDDFAVFVANWQNKAENVRHIQKVLNIGFDSMVFLDDNPAERAAVREGVAGVTVPELPQDPAEYLEFLYGLNLFETASFSAEDRERTRSYQEAAQRTALQQSFADESEFLRSLDMEATVEGLTPYNSPRVAQLSQRSNQFNLRTVRWSEADLQALAQDLGFHIFVLSLKDRFGDSGIVSVVALRERTDGAEKTLFIENWLMSCRVLNRGLEKLAMNRVFEFARRKGVQTVSGEYIPTAKNGLVKDFFARFGFVETEQNRYMLKVENYKNQETLIRVKETL